MTPEQLLLLSQSNPALFQQAMSTMQAQQAAQTAQDVAAKRGKQMTTALTVAAGVVALGLVGKRLGWWKRLGF